MTQVYRYPLYDTADRLARIFARSGFALYDLGADPELEPAGRSFPVFSEPEELAVTPLRVDNNNSILRPRVLPTQLPKLKGELPLRSVAIGRIYNAKDGLLPSRLRLEGIYVDPSLTQIDWQTFWQSIVENFFGIRAKAVLDGGKIKVDGSTFAYYGPLSWTANAILGTEGVPGYGFTIDIDSLALQEFAIKDRSALYDVNTSSLVCHTGESPACSEPFLAKVTDVMRRHGFLEFSGDKIYTADAYKKMNMIQAAWDKNNTGIPLCEPIGDRTGLPTVLTPALEEALAVNYKAGKESVRIFEIGHIFLPGTPPTEKISLSAGLYEPDMDIRKFTGLVDRLLTEFGIKNHFFFPTDMAIAYNTRETRVILDEHMQYLGGNFGGISEKAEANHGIGTHAFMLQFELEPLKKKAAEEYGFIPPEEK